MDTAGPSAMPINYIKLLPVGIPVFAEFSTAVLVGLRCVDSMFRDLILELPDVMVDVVVNGDTGKLTPPLPTSLPKSLRKHLRIDMVELCCDIWSCNTAFERFSVSLSESLVVLKDLDTLYLRGPLPYVASCLVDLVASKCLDKVNQVDLVIVHPAYSKWRVSESHKSSLLAAIRSLAKLDSLTLDALLITFREINVLGEMAALKSLAVTGSIWEGGPLRLPHVLRLDLRVMFNCQAVSDSAWLFDHASFSSGLTHLTLEHRLSDTDLAGYPSMSVESNGDELTDFISINRLLRHVLPLVRSSLAVLDVGEAFLDSDTVAVLKGLPCLHTLHLQGIDPEGDLSVFPALQDFKCTSLTPEMLAIMPSLTSLNCTTEYDMNLLSKLPPLITSLKAHSNIIDFQASGFSGVTKLYRFLEPGVQDLTNFPNLVILTLENHLCDAPTLRSFLHKLALQSSPRVTSLTLCRWRILPLTVLTLTPLLLLKQLTLEHCELSLEVLRSIVRGLPGLMRLDIIRCKGVTKLRCREVAYEAALKPQAPAGGEARDIAFRLVCNDREITLQEQVEE